MAATRVRQQGMAYAVTGVSAMAAAMRSTAFLMFSIDVAKEIRR